MRWVGLREDELSDNRWSDSYVIETVFLSELRKFNLESSLMNPLTNRFHSCLRRSTRYSVSSKVLFLSMNRSLTIDSFCNSIMSDVDRTRCSRIPRCSAVVGGGKNVGGSTLLSHIKSYAG